MTQPYTLTLRPEFPALIDAVERTSRGEHGLSQESLAGLARLKEPAEVLVWEMHATLSN